AGEGPEIGPRAPARPAGQPQQAMGRCAAASAFAASSAEEQAVQGELADQAHARSEGRRLRAQAEAAVRRAAYGFGPHPGAPDGLHGEEKSQGHQDPITWRLRNSPALFDAFCGCVC
ncbi:unnamed protein product, partial [Prorocentrum cordatum]